MRIPATQNVFVGHSTSEPHTASPTGMQGIQLDSPKAGIRTQMKVGLEYKSECVAVLQKIQESRITLPSFVF